MNIEITERIPRDKWLAALGTHGTRDESLNETLDEVESALLAAAKPKAIYRVMDIADIKVQGFSLKKHLEGCHKVIVMALTLGAGTDSLIRKLQVTDMAKAVMADSGASVLVECLCDKYEEHIKAATDGYKTGRFSPGYGDCPLEMQKSVISYVDGQRKIGLNVTANFLMIPRKSVTAIIGVADHPVKGRLATCGECVLREKCTLRREGKFCGD